MKDTKAIRRADKRVQEFLKLNYPHRDGSGAPIACEDKDCNKYEAQAIVDEVLWALGMVRRSEQEMQFVEVTSENFDLPDNLVDDSSAVLEEEG